MRVLVYVALLTGFVQAEVRPASVGAIRMTVSDLDRSLAFYTKVLSFEKESVREARLDSFDRLTGIFGTNVRVATLRLGAERLQLVEFITPGGRAIPSQSRSNDGWFQHIAIVVSDMEKAYDRLRQAKVRQISTVPQTLPESNRNAAGIKAFYFRDPDNHPLELIWFPKDKGDEKWHATRDLFLGIDHTAISVRSTERSLAFYRDKLGMTIGGESFNYGTEQEHLNHVFGSRVRITNMKAPNGPGIEFLEYVVPTDGRPIPPDTHLNDLWDWSSTIFVEDLEEARKLFRLDAVDTEPLVKGKGMFVRDPDGHSVLILKN